jgi:hypothetical protein
VRACGGLHTSISAAVIDRQVGEEGGGVEQVGPLFLPAIFQQPHVVVASIGSAPSPHNCKNHEHKDSVIIVIINNNNVVYPKMVLFQARK